MVNLGSREEARQKKLFKLADNFRNEDIEIATGVYLDLTRLKYGHIKNGIITRVAIYGQVIDLNDSWAELEILLLGTLHSRLKSNKEFFETLVKCEVCSVNTSVSESFGKISTDEGQKVFAYKIFDTGLYLETNLNVEDTFNMITRIVKELGIPYENFQYVLDEPERIGLRLSNIRTVISEVGVDGLLNKLKSSTRVVGFRMFGNRVNVISFDDMIYSIIRILLKSFGDNALEYMRSNSQVGLCINKKLKDFTYRSLEYTVESGEELFMYLGNSVDKQMKEVDFLEGICEELELNEDDLRIYLEQLQVERKRKGMR